MIWFGAILDTQEITTMRVTGAELTQLMIR